MEASVLEGLRIVELSAFVAAPLGGMTLAQLGAEVVRIDQAGGGPDLGRWPVTADGASLYWHGLNKAKRSVFLDLRSVEGRRAARALACEAGALLTNMPARDWLAFESLRAERPDLIMVSIAGTHEGGAAVDYTVQARTGLPFATGPARPDAPVNQQFPAWDAICGLLAAVGLLAAERRRRETGEGQFVALSLQDAALWMLGNLGYLAEVELLGRGRQASGNDLYGAFGRDFATADGRRLMLVALTPRHWAAVCAATGLGPAFAHLEAALRADFTQDADRWRCRQAIAALLEPWFAARTLEQVRASFEAHRVLWSPYQSLEELVRDDPACSPANPLFQRIEQPGLGSHLAPGTPLRFAGGGARPVRAAPVPGSDTRAVLAAGLGLDDAELDRLAPEGHGAGEGRS